MMEVVYATLTALGAGAVGWIFSRRKALAEVKSTDIDNAVKNAKYYQDLVDDLAERLRTTLDELHEATQTVRNQNQTIQDLSAKINELTSEKKGINQKK